VVYNYQGHSGCFHSISNSSWKFAGSNASFTWDSFISVAFGVIFWYWVQYLMSNQLETEVAYTKKNWHPITATLESVNRVWLEMSLIKSYSHIVLKHTYPFHTQANAIATHRVRGDLHWILRKISLLKEWSDIGTGCPGRWLSHHPWRCSKNM